MYLASVFRISNINDTYKAFQSAPHLHLLRVGPRLRRNAAQVKTVGEGERNAEWSVGAARELYATRDVPI